MFALQVLRDGVNRAIFALEIGSFRLGSGAEVELPVSHRFVGGVLCRVDRTPGDEVVVRALDAPGAPRIGLRSGELVDRTTLINCEPVTLGAVTLLLNVTPEAASAEDELQVRLPAAPGDPTAPSSGVLVPTTEALALRLRTARGSQTVPLGNSVAVTVGRGPGNDVALVHPEVSRHHARLFWKADGLWVKDLGSAHGTLLNGAPVREAQLPPGSVLRFSLADDAPELTLLPLSHAMDDPAEDDLTAPLRGRTPVMRRLRQQLHKLAPLPQPVLIGGETGTGKEPAARALARGRPGKELVVVNCAAIPASLFESYLFGHRRGAFTGATHDQVGLVEHADGGTLFLDEIGDLPLELQPKFLRVLQTGEVQRIGDRQPRRVQFRLVSATHRDLPARVAEGLFREDLLFRINTLQLTMPPLRERREDIEVLARSFLRALVLPKAKPINEEALAKLKAWRWPGNVRELEGVMLRAAVDAMDRSEREIGPESIVFVGETQREEEQVAGLGDAAALPRIDDLPVYLDWVAEALCLRAMEESDGNLAAAARALRLSESALRRRLAAAKEATR